MKISLLCPTRNRPSCMLRLWESAWNTADNKTDLEVVFYMDNDDVHSLEQFEKMDSPQHLGICGNRIVLSQMWNECSKVATGEILMHCFPAGELVMTIDGPRPIETIKIGDFVMVGDGSLRPVTKLYQRDYEGELHLLKVGGMPSVKVTSNHNVFATTGIWRKTIHFTFDELQKTAVRDLTNQHFMAYPIPKDCGILSPSYATETYCRLAGWYLSEGSVFEGKSTWRTTFDLHVKEEDYAKEISEFLCQLIDEGFSSPNQSLPYTYIQRNNCRRTHFLSTKLAQNLKTDFGKFAWGKQIPSWIMFGKLELSKYLLRGMWLGDGYFPSNKNWHFTTVSPDLAYGMRLLLSRHGIVSTLEEKPAYTKNNVNHRKSYKVYVGQEAAKEKLALLIGLPYEPRINKKHKNSFPVADNRIYSRVTNNTSTSFKGIVYNIQVEQKHEYVAACGLVGNCGDDIIFRSQGWDTLVREHINSYPDKIAFVHGMDGIQNEKLGTHGFLHRNWVDVVGYFVPPYFSCDYNDTWLTEVSSMIGRRIYEPRIYTEHMHWAVGKQPRDQTYSDTMARGHRDNVTAMYNSMLPQRQEDAKKLREFIERVKGS